MIACHPFCTGTTLTSSVLFQFVISTNVLKVSRDASILPGVGCAGLRAHAARAGHTARQEPQSAGHDGELGLPRPAAYACMC
eukprot:scaffold168377_cov22-Tisochrysis_lutea.AAC.1